MMREYKRDELLKHIGEDTTLPILVAVKGKIFDVTSGKKFYGPSGSYPLHKK